MKRVFSSLMAILIMLPMVFPLAATGGENMANYLYNGTTYLAASEPVDPNFVSKLSITTGGSANGDGMALYNGVMLPKLPDASGYPFAWMTYLDLGLVSAELSGEIIYALYYTTVAPDSYDEGVRYSEQHILKSYAITFSRAAAEFAPSLDITVSVGEWSLQDEFTSDAGTYTNDPFWTNTDILNTDSTTYLAASDPISLDGMNVITWDGDTTGLVTLEGDGLLCKVSDSTLTADEVVGGVAVITSLTGAGNMCDTIESSWVEEDSDLGATIFGGVVYSAYNTNFFPETGLYFLSYPEFSYMSLLAYPASSGGGVTDTTATVNFTCTDLLYTDSVYRIKAWVYKASDSLDVTLAPTWTSELFSGPSHSESHTFTGLTPATEYAVYAVIWSETDGAATEHNATATFTTLEGEGLDFSNTEMLIFDPNVTNNTADFAISWSGLPVTTADHVHYFIAGELDDGTAAKNSPFYLFSSSAAEDGEHELIFSDLKPNTAYTVTAKLLYNTTGESSGFTDSGVEVTLDFTTLSGFDRDAFLLGFASGLGCTAATKTDADHNTWLQGYLVGDALRNAITTKQSFKHEVSDLSAAVRMVAEFIESDTLEFNAHNGSMILCATTPNEATFTDRTDATRYLIPIPAEASKVTVETTDTQVTMAQFVGVNGSNGSYTKVFSSAREAVYSYEFQKGSAQWMAIDLIYEDTGAVTVPWDYVATNTTVTFT